MSIFNKNWWNSSNSIQTWFFGRVNSVQEDCAKCFTVQNKKHQNDENWKLRVWCSLFHFFHVIWKILKFNMWPEKHLVQAFCTDLTLILKIYPWKLNLSKLKIIFLHDLLHNRVKISLLHQWFYFNFQALFPRMLQKYLVKADFNSTHCCVLDCISIKVR